MHMRIRRDGLNRDFQLSDFDRRYLTIPEMIHFYTRNRLPIKGAEHMCLKQPIAINLLWVLWVQDMYLDPIFFLMIYYNPGFKERPLIIS